MIKVIVATDNNNVIGNNTLGGDLLWHVSSDLKFFKQQTNGHAIILGKTTFDAIARKSPKFLPGRWVYILSRTLSTTGLFDYTIGEEALFEETVASYRFSENDLFVCGGRQTYKKFFDMDVVSEIIMTNIDVSVPWHKDNIYFPSIPKRFSLVKTELLEENENQTHTISIYR